MKIIITGATGSLGAHLVRHYAAAGHEVVALGRTQRPPCALLKLAVWHNADITKPFKLPDADHIIHAAGLADDHASKEDLWKANVIGTQHVCEAASHIPSFVHISSSSVYTNFPEAISELFTEHSHERNLSPYGWSKLQSERVVLEKRSNAHATILRPRGIYGPGDKVLLPRLLRMVKNGSMVAPGEMSVKLSLTHFENLAHAIDCAFRFPQNSNRAYNLSDANPYILFEALKQLLDGIFKTNLPVKHLPLWMVKLLAQFRISGLSPLFVNTVSQNVVLDITKIRDEINYQPPREFYSSIPEISSWIEQIGGVDVLKTANPELAWK
jgi:nucleoside-diphosphate-sugar epimerase